MDLEMVFNELSSNTPADDIPTARKWMSGFIQVLSQATRNGVKRVLRTHEDLSSIELAPDYPIARWRNDREVNQEERSFFRSLTAKAPLWSDLSEAIKRDFVLSEVCH
jgi:hypothetical protein